MKSEKAVPSEKAPIKVILQNLSEVLVNLLEHPQTPNGLWKRTLEFADEIRSDAHGTDRDTDWATLEHKLALGFYCEALVPSEQEVQKEPKVKTVTSKKPKKQAASSRPKLVQAA
jgi:hypothetical protein